MSQSHPTRTANGFSLIEVLIVVAIIGIIAAIGAPILHDARISAQRSSALSNIRRIHGAQAAYRIQYNRYGTLQELNAYQGGGLGQTLSAQQLSITGYTYNMTTPTTPTVANVETGFTVQASGYTSSGQPNVYLLQADGSIQQILPVIKDIVRFN